MRFAVLGPVEVRLEDGNLLALGSTREGTLLAILLVHAGQTVSASRLIDALWAGDAPAGAAATLPTYVRNLRRLLGDPARIITKRPGYALHVEPEELDLWEYERLVGDARLNEAFALWRGRPLADLADEPFAMGWVALLEERHLSSQHDYIERLLAQGDHRQAIPELEAIVEANPFHERFWGQLMLALYRSGRQAEALRAYGRVRTLLADELGIDPGVELRQLEDDILQQRSSIDWPPSGSAISADTETGRAPSSEPSERQRVERPPLPAHLASLLAAHDGDTFVGRAADMDWLDVLWRRATSGYPQVAIVDGAPGMGKRRLVAEFAKRVHAGGAVIAELPIPVIDEPTLAIAPVDQLPEPSQLTGAVMVVAIGHADRASPPVQCRMLQPLDHAAIAQLLHETLGEPPDPQIVTAIADESGGITGRVVELVHRLAERDLADRVERAVARAASARGTFADEIDQIEFGLRRATRDHRPSPVSSSMCPYKGLARFEAADSDLFCGRESLVAALVARLVTLRFVAVVGASGSGKSSLVRAGLVPAIANGAIPGSESWRIALVTPSTVASTLPEADLLVLDQLEELLTLSMRAAQPVDELIEQIVEYPGRVVVTVRSDHYGRFAAWPALAGLLVDGQLLIGAMNEDDLRRAIEEPARRSGLRVEPALTEVVIADTGGAAGALPLVSTALLETWVRREGEVLTRAAYLAAGGIRGAVAGLAEGVYESFTDEQRVACRRLFLRLAEPGGGSADVRRRASIAELGTDGERLLPTLVSRRLVAVDADWCEVAHEALLREWPRLVAWLEEDRNGRRQHRALTAAAATWDAGGRDDGDLYRGARLVGALDWMEGHPRELNVVEQAFLDRSREAAERELTQAHRRSRRLRRLVAGLAVLLVVAVVAGVAAVHQRRAADRAQAGAEAAGAEAVAQAEAADRARADAQAQARTATARGLAGEALSLLDVDLDQALGRAIEAYRTEPLVETRSALLAALTAAAGLQRTIPFGADVVVTGLDEWGTQAAVLTRDGTLQFWDLTRGEPSGRPFAVSAANATAIVFDRSGTRIAIAHGSEVDVWAVATGAHIAGPFEGGKGDLIDVAFTADGEHLVTTSFRDNSAHLIDLNGTAPKLLGGGIISAVPLIPDNIVLTGDVLGSMQRWDARSGEAIGEPMSIAAIPLTSQGPVWALKHLIEEIAVSPDGAKIATGIFGGFVTLSDVETGESWLLPEAEQQTTVLHFSLDGTRLLGLSSDGRLRVWTTTHPADPPIEVPAPLRSVDAATFNAGGALVFAGPGGARVYDLNAGPAFGTAFEPFAAMDTEGIDVEVDEVTYRPDGPLVAVASDIDVLRPGPSHGALATWDPGTDSAAATESLSSGAIALDISPDGRFLAIAQPYGSATVRDLESGATIELPGFGSTSVAFSPTGDLLAVSAKVEDSSEVRWFSAPAWELLDVTVYRPPGSTSGFTDLPTGLAFSSDGRTLAVANSQSQAALIDVATRTVAPSTVTDGPGIAYSVTLDHDGRHLYEGQFFGQIDVFDPFDTNAKTIALIGHNNVVTDLALSLDERTLFSVSFDGSLILWDVTTNARLGVPIRPRLTDPPAALNVAVAPDGAHVAVGYSDGRVVQWEIDPEAWLRHACEIVAVDACQ